MKPKADLYTDAPVLEAAIADEAFSSFATSLQQVAIHAVRRRRHVRQVRIALAQVTCVIGLGALLWFGYSKPQNVANLGTSAVPATPAASGHYITEDQMLAMFPNGSCVVAEVNGRKELVFLDRKSSEQMTQ